LAHCRRHSGRPAGRRLWLDLPHRGEHFGPSFRSCQNGLL
jgi:hypothetical protein